MATLFHRHGCKAVVFDMDGVLIDSEPLHFQVLGELCQSLGFTLTWERFVPFIGKDEVTFWTWAIREHQLGAPMQDYIRTYLDRLNRFFTSTAHIPPIDGVVELLEALKREGMGIGLASSSAIRVIEDTLGTLGISQYFDALAGADQVGKSKPDPAVYRKAMEDLGVAPSECGAIEDSNYGMLAAKASGAFCVAYRNPSAGEQDLSMADAAVDSLRELL
ncbi:HAD family hydrolase [Zongyangia hominis]|uniref:HAD family phosphatase n=1 Tax=Zongyangia hominis TaxID=2763677 RepID=A0A926EAU0_9FIRM|nr:HAD family phosphatase [Zongyangia hominis]MBC8571115.1 HAD family phosphatase [Zongyangia hominis]